ncbi:Protein of unknown function [Leuconostoc citreum LBAE C10]|nr:Protein of unknown function [Leuconostoc citreum LBAE C10]
MDGESVLLLGAWYFPLFIYMHMTLTFGFASQLVSLISQWHKHGKALIL